MVISVHQGVTIMPQWRMAAPVDFELDNGEHIAIVGPNASGKTMLTDIITGAHPLIGQRVAYDFHSVGSTLASDNIRYITFRDSYGSAADAGYYLQQRWNQTEIDEELPTMGEMLTRVLRSGPTAASPQSALHSETSPKPPVGDGLFPPVGGTEGGRGAGQTELERLCRTFGITHLLDKPLILLSSGELRRFVLCRALLAHPRVLIVDNPFIGLDAATRLEVRELLTTLSREGDLQIIVVVARDADIPDFITHVVPVENMKVLPKMSREAYLSTSSPNHKPCAVALPGPAPHHSALHSETSPKPPAPLQSERAGGEAGREIVSLRKVSIRYGQRTILKDLDWTVMSGERWALTGQNGAGKSTLLSLVCADNPQSYACDISLFGHRRGTGESIWEIKRHIGYVSPELHRAYNRDLPAITIVASGLKDTAGLHINASPEDYEKCRQWMEVLGIEHLAERTFLHLSSGEQRMVLLARAFVKDPALLILDEPLHGLDAARSAHVKAVIDAFAQRPDKTLIMVSHYEEDFPSCITHRLHLQTSPKPSEEGENRPTTA